MYAWIRARGGGAHVEVHQLVDSQAKADFMQACWSMVLGRLAAGVAAACHPDSAIEPRPPRPKRRDTPGRPG